MEFTQKLFDRINSFDTLKAGFEAIAAETGYSTTTIVNNYGKYKREIKSIYLKDTLEKRDKELLKELSKNPDNLQKVFKELAIKYKVTPKALATRYYTKLKNNPDCPIFTIVGKKSGHMNVKNNIGNKYPRHKTTHNFVEKTWGKIKFFINNILK